MIRCICSFLSYGAAFCLKNNLFPFFVMSWIIGFSSMIKDCLDSDESIQDILANLQDILEENVDEGEDPIRVFSVIGEYCAHDVEGFLYDYIAELLDHADDGYAGELLDGFFPFISESIWFEFLRARALSFTDPFKANAKIALILDKHPHNETIFLFDILRFLSISGEHGFYLSRSSRKSSHSSSRKNSLKS